MPEILIPVTDMSPELGELSPPNNNMLIVENIFPTVSGYDRQINFAPNSIKHPVVKFMYAGPTRIIEPPTNIFATKFYTPVDNTSELSGVAEFIFACTQDKIWVWCTGIKDDLFYEVTSHAASEFEPVNWFNEAPISGGRGAFTRFGKYVILTNVISQNTFTFDMEAFWAERDNPTGNVEFEDISKNVTDGMTGFGAYTICTFKSNVFLGHLNISASSPVDGLSGYQPELLWWSDDFSPTNWGSSDATPTLAGTGYLRLIDNHGAITALAPTDSVLYAFKEDAIYAVSGPPYTYDLLVTGIGTKFPNTVFTVKDTVYFWSQQGPARISGNGVEVLGEGKWARMVSGSDAIVPTSNKYRYPRIYAYETDILTNNNNPSAAFDYETNCAVFAFPARVRNMGSPDPDTEMPGVSEILVVERDVLDYPDGVNGNYYSFCDTVVVVNTLTGAASINYPMNLDAAVTDGVLDAYGFVGPVQRPYYNTLLTAFRVSNTYGYENLEDQYLNFGSLTTNAVVIETSATSGLPRYISQFSCTKYNKLAIVTPWVELERGATAKVHNVRLEFLTQDGSHAEYDGLAGSYNVSCTVHRKSSAGANREYVTNTGVRRDGTMIVPEDRYSRYKMFEIELWRGYAPAVGETPESSAFNTLATFVPMPGKLVGIHVEFSVQQKVTG